MPPKKLRLDLLLVARGFAASRERARALILAGRVRVGEAIVTKAGTLVSPDSMLTLTESDHPYVGRGGVKLAHALDVFHIQTTDRRALDIGASTGGFTDVLLARGAAHVVSLDVGHGQLDWKLRTDPRVTVIDGLNARALTPADLPENLRSFDIVVIDVSFISLKQIVPVVPPLLGPGADVIALVKPQFEAGRAEVKKGGLVRDAVVHDRVVSEVATAANRIGLAHVATTPSPILGAEGNREFFLHLRQRV